MSHEKQKYFANPKIYKWSDEKKNLSEGEKYLYLSSDRKEISVSTTSRQNDIVMMTTNKKKPCWYNCHTVFNI